MKVLDDNKSVKVGRFTTEVPTKEGVWGWTAQADVYRIERASNRRDIQSHEVQKTEQPNLFQDFIKSLNIAMTVKARKDKDGLKI
jgi:hypothetical protein